MKIAFVSVNQEKLPDPVVPIGLLSVQASVPSGHQTEFWDLCFESNPLSWLQEKVEAFRPDLLALGMRNLQNADYSDQQATLDHYQAVIGCLRSLCSAPIVLGGSGFSVVPERLMDYLRPDFGISGEGEQVFSDFLALLGRGSKSFSELPGFYWFEGQNLQKSRKERAFLDLNGLARPSVASADARYFSLTGTASVQTKRGCPLHCTYCTYPQIEGKEKRLRDPGRVLDEMQEAVRENPRIEHFFVVDSAFNLPAEHAKAFCRLKRERRFLIPWTAYVNPIGFDKELASLMVESGCAGIEVGSDSGDDSVLAMLKKGFDSRSVLDLSRISRQAGLKDCHSFILGTPGETLEGVRQTLDFIIRMDPYCAILGVWVDDEELLNPGLAESRREMREKVKALLWQMKDDYPHWVIPALKVNFEEKFFNLLRKRKLRGPLWEHIRPVRVALGERR